jgi:collagen type VII alpha
VGIGTTAPTGALYVVGDVTIDGALNVTDPVVQQSDIGTDPNQIPLNQYLGSLAYQNREWVTVDLITSVSGYYVGENLIIDSNGEWVGSQAGISGESGESGFSGGPGASGESGFSGAVGVSGTSGFSGQAGPSNVLNATDTTTAGTYYPVFVDGAGTNTTPRVRSTATAFSFNPGTGVVSAVDFDSLSDQTLKTNIQNITNSWDILGQLRPVSFDWKDIPKSSFGLVAQEVQSVQHNLVGQAQHGLTVSYIQLIPLLIHALQTQQQRISDLEKQIISPH